jgi:hypothetical protein
MSQTSKVNSTLRSNIIQSLNLYSPKSNTQLFESGIANPASKFSLRAIQEATQKLTVLGELKKIGTKYVAVTPNSVTVPSF